MAGSRLYLSKLSSGLVFSGETEWSRINPYKPYLYPNNTSLLQTMDLSNCVSLPACGTATPPSPTLVYDFKSSSNCLGASFNVTWTDEGGVSAGDTAFGMVFSNSGFQGGAGAHYVAAYVPGKGCAVLNTVNGAITTDQGFVGSTGLSCTGSGCTGTVPNWVANFGAGGFSIHNNKIGRSGVWDVVVPCGNFAGCGIPCSTAACASPIFWQVGTNVVNIPTSNLSGHFTEGYLTWVNGGGKFTGRLFTSPGVPSTWSAITIQDEQHVGWNNADPSDTFPILASTWTNTVPPFPAPYFNEVIGVTPHTNATTFRFSPTFNTGRSSAFSVTQAIGSVSQDGRFFAVSSDWMGTLGAENGAATCVLGGPQGGTNCRGDVFVVNLQ
jgi:hypothetical protein